MKKQLKFEFDETLLQYSNELDRLKAENEDLKKRISGYKCPMEKNADYCGHLEESGLRYVENEFLKQTLTEIKEIAELKQKQSVFVGETVFEQILQKISEVSE